jgi:hypothetical protein
VSYVSKEFVVGPLEEMCRILMVTKYETCDTFYFSVWLQHNHLGFYRKEHDSYNVNIIRSVYWRTQTNKYGRKITTTHRKMYKQKKKFYFLFFFKAKIERPPRYRMRVIYFFVCWTAKFSKHFWLGQIFFPIFFYLPIFTCSAVCLT